MSTTDVNMQEVEEVVIVTIPDNGTVTEHVSSEEEGVTTERNHETGEDVLAIATMESESEASIADTKEESVIVKLTEEVNMGVDVEADIFYPITCGDTKATLVWKKFVCPGINIKCVQLNEQLISPKEFVCLSGKSTLKDWKRAIRLNGTMLRKIMDSGELDFYQHVKVCSNTCRSTKIDLVGSKVSVSSQHSTELLPITPSSSDINGLPTTFPEVMEESSEWVTAIGEDSVMFWSGVKEAGLLDEVVEEFQKELTDVLKGMHERVSEPPLQVKDAVLLNNIVQNFGMLDLVKRVLASHKSQMDRYREQYTRSLAALEQQCDEHRKRAKELKSKSQHLNNVLMTLTPVAVPAAPKRPRLTRALSGPATVSASPAHISVPLSQLGKVLTVAGGPAAGSLGSYTLLTSPVGSPELAADHSKLTLLSAAPGGQEGVAPGTMAFVKMVSPQYQLVTLPTTLQSAVVPLPMGNISAVPSEQTAGPPLVDEGLADAQPLEEAAEEQQTV